jgi:hypothetical protein
MNATLVRIRRKIESEKRKLRGISPLIMTDSYSEVGAGLTAESVL